jgi:hypothetical protein
MAESKKTPAPKLNATSKEELSEKIPVTNVHQRNTEVSEDVEETNKDTGERGTAAVNMIVNRTGQVPADVKALEAELVDQVRTEEEAEKSIQVSVEGASYDALTLERLDHARSVSILVARPRKIASSPSSAMPL